MVFIDVLNRYGGIIKFWEKCFFFFKLIQCSKYCPSNTFTNCHRDNEKAIFVSSYILFGKLTLYSINTNAQRQPLLELIA